MFYGIWSIIVAMAIMFFSRHVRADLMCTISIERDVCSPLPVIVEATIDLSDSITRFDFVARYQSCFSERNVKIQGRLLQTVNHDSAQEFELLGEYYEPVTDFIVFPRTIAYLMLDKTTLQGMLTDVWSAQQLMHHPKPAHLTVPVNCRKI